MLIQLSQRSRNVINRLGEEITAHGRPIQVDYQHTAEELESALADNRHEGKELDQKKEEGQIPSITVRSQPEDSTTETPEKDPLPDTPPEVVEFAKNSDPSDIAEWVKVKAKEEIKPEEKMQQMLLVYEAIDFHGRTDSSVHVNGSNLTLGQIFKEYMSGLYSSLN